MIKKQLFHLLLLLVFLVGFGSIHAQKNVLQTTICTESEPAPATGRLYTDKTILAVWMEDLQGNFVKTLAFYSQNTRHRRYLLEFAKKNPSYNTLDAITGATLQGHGIPIQTLWNLQDTLGTDLPAGKYILRCEQTSHNGQGPLTTDTIDVSTVHENSLPYVLGFQARNYKMGVPVYNASQILVLQAFLRQPSAEAGKTNAEQLSVMDTTSWTINNDWILNLTGVNWVSIQDTLQISKIDWSNKKLAGKMDLSAMDNLTELVCNDNKLENIVLKNTFLLTKVACENNSMKLSELPITRATSFTFSPQDTLQGGTIACTSVLDLSSEKRIIKQYESTREVTLDCNEKQGFQNRTIFPDYSKWFYYSLKDGKYMGSDDIDKTLVVDTVWKKRTDWDIAFHGGNVKFNGGFSGNGQGGCIKITNAEFGSFNTAPTEGYKQDADTLKGAFYSMKGMPPAYCDIVYSKEVEGWAATNGMAFEVDTTLLAVKTANGKYAKVLLKSFANENGDNGYITFDYFYQSNGSTDLTSPETSANSTFAWFDITDETPVAITEGITNNGAKFSFNKDLAGKNLRCEISNEAYPGHVFVYHVNIEALSTDASLKSLAIDKGTLSPDFEVSTFDYTAEVENETDTIVITAQTNHANATLTGIGKFALELGENQFTVKAKAENESIDQDYTLIITRKAKNMAIADTLEVRKLKAFLRQPSVEVAKINAEQLGLSIADTTTWDSNNDWMLKVIGVTFKLVDGIQKVTSIQWNDKKLAGSLDVTNYKSLAELSCAFNRLTDLKLFGNLSLTHVACNNNNLKFSTLPIQNFAGTYQIHLQEMFVDEEISHTDIIDLGSEYSTGGTSEPLVEKVGKMRSYDWGKWHYFSFDTGDKVGETVIDPSKTNDPDWATRNDWDLAFHYDNIRTNSGHSGNGNGGILLSSTPYEQLFTAPANGYKKDMLAQSYYSFNMPPQKSEMGLSVEAQSWITGTGMGQTPTPSMNTYVVKTAKGKYAKVVFTEFYWDNATQSGFTTFKYFYQPDGSNNLETTISADAKITDYKWFDITLDTLQEITTGITNNNGKFTLSQDHAGKTLRCEMTNENFSGLTLVYEVKVKETTGIETMSGKDNEITIYPNPASDWLHVKIDNPSEHSNLYIYDIQGKQVLSKYLGNISEMRLPISSIPNGTYIVKIVQGSKCIIQKLIVKD